MITRLASCLTFKYGGKHMNIYRIPIVTGFWRTVSTVVGAASVATLLVVIFIFKIISGPIMFWLVVSIIATILPIYLPGKRNY